MMLNNVTSVHVINDNVGTIYAAGQQCDVVDKQDCKHYAVTVEHEILWISSTIQL